MKYAVIAYQNFDTDTSVYLFDDYHSAQEFMRKLFKNEKTEMENSLDFHLDQKRTYCKENLAQLWCDNGDFTRYVLTEPSEPF